MATKLIWIRRAILKPIFSKKSYIQTVFVINKKVYSETNQDIFFISDWITRLIEIKIYG